MKDVFKIYLPSLNATKKIAEKLALITEKQLFISLRGNLGTGKTTFAKYYITKLLKKKINVTSPSFPLVNLYEMENKKIWHYDLYRLKNPSEVFSLDFDQALNDIILIEWPEIIEKFLPKNRIEIKFSECENFKFFLEIKFLGKCSVREKFRKNG